jgi:hypothetical protein
LARNGEYDVRLSVANGYSYSISYNYTTPCKDSGTVTGKFDVKKAISNFVKVETPPCQAN